MSQFTDYEKHVKTLDQSQMLGSIAWLGISSETVDYDDVLAKAQSVGLEGLVGNRPPDSDVFRRVFQAGQRRKHDLIGSTNEERILIRQVKDDKDEILRRFVIETADAAGETLDYVEMYEVRFNKATSFVERKSLQSYDNLNTEDLMNKLYAQYQDEIGCCSPGWTRIVLHRGLDAMQATGVRETGSVFFIASAFNDYLEKLELFANSLPNADMHSLPLLDDRKQRDMVRHAFEVELTKDIEEAVKKAAEVLDKGVTTRSFRAHHQNFLALQKKVTTYQDLLNFEIDKTTTRFTILGKQINSMFKSAG